MSAAEKIIADALQHAVEWGANQRPFEDRPPFASELIAALRADRDGFAHLCSLGVMDGSADAASDHAEALARAEKAERERDEFRSQAALFQQRVAQLERPMTTVDEDGRVWRVEIANDGADSWYLTRDGMTTTIPAHSTDRFLFVLVPMEGE